MLQSAIGRTSLWDYFTSKKPVYGALGLALLHDIRPWCCVGKGAGAQ